MKSEHPAIDEQGTDRDGPSSPSAVETLSPSEMHTQLPDDALTTFTGDHDAASGEVPDRIGRLEIQQWLGAGGMGAVYRAYDAQLDRMVAVKLVRRGASDEARSRRLQREARALARVSHPNVVQVFDVGLHEGQVFVAMELVDGQTLRSWLEQEPRSQRDVLRVFIEAAEGLEAAHAAGVVHRDFKPDNVMIDARGRVRVLDFGLAQTDHDQPEGGVARVTADLQHGSSLMGTPAYMAPEQILGQPLDARTDMFALCIALWEALYGQHPFEGETAMELVCNIVDDKRRPPPRRSQVPARLRRVLDRGLHIDPEQRWPDLDALLDPLRKELRGVDRLILLLTTPMVFAALLGPWLLQDSGDPCADVAVAVDQAWGPAKRDTITQAYERSGLRHGATHAEPVLETLESYAREWRAAKHQLCTTVQAEGGEPSEQAKSHDMCLEQHLASFQEVVTLLTEASDGEPAGGSGLDIVHVLPPLHDCERKGSMVPAEQHLALGLRLARLRTRVAAERYHDARPELSALVQELDEIDAPSLQAEGYLALGKTQDATGQLDEAVASLERAFDLSIVAGTPSTTVKSAVSIGQILGYDQQRYAEGLIWLRTARPFTRLLYERAPERVSPQQVEAMIAIRQGDGERALELLQEVLDHGRSIFGEGDVRLAGILNNMATAHSDLGHDEEAEKTLLAVVELVESTLGPDDPELSAPLHNLAGIAFGRGEYDRATELFERSLSITEASRGSQSPGVAMALISLARLETDRGIYEPARSRLERAESILRQVHGDKGVDLGMALLARGRLELADDNPQGALAPLERGVELVDAAMGDQTTFAAFGLDARGEALLAVGRPAEAVASLRRSVEIVRALAPGTIRSARTEWLLAQALWAADEPEQARRFAEQARATYAAHPESKALHDEVERWLAEHPSANPEDPSP